MPPVERSAWITADPAAEAPIDPVSLITPEVVEEYRRDGVVMVRQALHPEWLRLIEMAFERVLHHSSQRQHLFFDGQPQQFVETVRNHEVTPELQHLLVESPIADMIGRLIGSENLWLYSDEMFVKDNPGAARTPWHQDLPYWPLEGDQIASMWISLDPLPQVDCLEYVRGTHRGPMHDGFNPRRVGEDPTLPYYGQDLPPLPDIEADRDAFDIVSWDIEPGDVILAHPGVIHGGGGTTTATRRRAITIRLYGDDVVYARRPPTRPTTPQTPGLSLILRPGDPLRASWYPQIRPRRDR